jgi:hypothetical protein
LQVDVTGEFQSQGVVLATPTFLSHLLLACRRKQKLDIAKLHNLLAKKISDIFEIASKEL